MLAFLALLTVRFLFGLGEAGAYPTISRAFHSWFPLQERGVAQGTVWMAGRFAGGITPLLVGLFLIRAGTVNGDPRSLYWRHIFWIFGGIGLVWCVLFWLWYRDRPEDHRGVNPDGAGLHPFGPNAGGQPSRGAVGDESWAAATCGCSA